MGETGRRSVGNRKERLRDYASSPGECGMKSLKQVWDRSLPRPVGETGRRSVGNGKERLRDYDGFQGRQPNVTQAQSAGKREHHILAYNRSTVSIGRFAPAETVMYKMDRALRAWGGRWGLHPQALAWGHCPQPPIPLRACIKKDNHKYEDIRFQL